MGIRITLRRIGVIGLGIGLLSVGMSGCNKPSNTSLGTAAPGSIQSNLDGSVYPHSAEFKKSTHGKAYQLNSATCKACHGDDLKGGNAKIGCTSCHAAYPHSDEFKATFEHGRVYLNDRSACVNCHKGENAAAPAGVIAACQKCHDYPHATGTWHKPEAHGAAFLAKDAKTVTCQNCHTSKSKFIERHADMKITCDSCHTIMPHPEGWDASHAEMGAGTSATRCTTCHTNYEAHMPNYSSCTACHDGSSEFKQTWVAPTPTPSGAPSASKKEEASRSVAGKAKKKAKPSPKPTPAPSH